MRGLVAGLTLALLPIAASSAPEASAACGTLLGVDRFCVAAAVEGVGLGCHTRIPDGNNSTGDGSSQRICSARFSWRVNGTSSPLPGTVHALLDGAGYSCLAMPECFHEGSSVVEAAADRGAAPVLHFAVRGSVEQPPGLGAPDEFPPPIMRVDVLAAAAVRVTG